MKGDGKGVVTGFIRQLTGSEWKVVLALAWAGGFGTISTLLAATALSKPTVYKSVDNLIRRGLLVGVNAGYQLTGGGLQLSFEIGRKFFTATESLSLLDTGQDQNIEAEPVKNFFTPSQQACYDLLSMVSEPTRTLLTQEGRMDANQLALAISNWRKRGGGVGLLVTMVRSDPIPETEEQQRQRYYDNAYKDSLEHEEE